MGGAIRTAGVLFVGQCGPHTSNQTTHVVLTHHHVAGCRCSGLNITVLQVCGASRRTHQSAHVAARAARGHRCAGVLHAQQIQCTRCAAHHATDTVARPRDHT